MCGIAGYVETGHAFADANVAAGMIATLRHRGPDDTGVWAGGPAALAAARLSIIDVAGGHQPIAVDAGRITVVQNGEIYNYVELRDELERRGRSFATVSDTEVIAALYAEAGEAAFERLRGMFAIAIWDEPRGRLVLARDRVGKKPLYYMQTGGRFVFASETKAILAALARTPEVAAAPLVEFLTFGYVAGEEAIFEGMSRLPPGCVLTLARGQSPRVRRYWTWPRDTDSGVPEREYLARLGAELDEAVRIRLRSDVPLGAFLSGGLDSAAVLALMAKHSSRPVQTFSIGFDDPEYDELAAARTTAQAFGADHHEWVVTPDCIAVADKLATHYDEPFADASAIPTFFVAELARRHVTVCLTGDGGDELFAGYLPYSQALGRSTAVAARSMRALARLGARCLPAFARPPPVGRVGWPRSPSDPKPGSCGAAPCSPSTCCGASRGTICCARRRAFPKRTPRGSSPPLTVRCCRGCSAGISSTICPATSWSKSIARRWPTASRRAARCSITASSSWRPNSRRGGTAARRRPRSCSGAWWRRGCRPRRWRARRRASACRCAAGSPAG